MSEFNYSNEKKTMKISSLSRPSGRARTVFEKGALAIFGQLMPGAIIVSHRAVTMPQSLDKDIFPQRSLKIKGKGQHVLSKKPKYFIEVVPTIFDFG